MIHKVARMRVFFTVFALFLSINGAAFAQSELGFYGGSQGSPHSNVSGNDPGGVGVFDFTAGWEGRSGAMPPYYGFRYTRWTSETLGWGIDFNHAKIYADDATLAASGFSRLEFTDGLNLLTLNAFRRWGDTGWSVAPYVGAGLGIAIPHVEVTSTGGTTFEYQITGPAVQWVAGASYPINDRWSVFGEYKGSYSVNSAELVSGGFLDTNIITNALNVGVSLGF
jgi:lipid A oxidase